MKAPSTEQMLVRRARKGYNPAESAAALTDLLAQPLSRGALVASLVYNGFATERGAEAFVAQQIALSDEIIAEVIAEEG